MAYTMYLNGVQMPVTPSKLTVKIKGQNKTLNLVNDGEINFLRSPGLTEITVEVLLPMLQAYHFASYPSGYQPPDYYLSAFERMIAGKTPGQFILSRYAPAGGRLYDTNLRVSLESYNIVEDASNGPDVTVSLTLKQYKVFGTKTVKLVEPTVAVVEKPRETDNAPKKENKAKTYTVKSGDCLWNIAKKYYGNGAKYTQIFNANKDKISNPNLIYPGQVLTIP